MRSSHERSKIIPTQAIREKIVERILSTLKDPQKAAKVAVKALSEADAISARISQYRQLQADEQNRRVQSELKLRQISEAIQKDCPHSSTTHYPDAAVGNDSEDRCDLCGKEM